MSRANKTRSNTATGEEVRASVSRLAQMQAMNHVKDTVYREMLLLEVNRPGAEMGLALALLRAVVHAQSLVTGQAEFDQWLKSICPVGLRMIESALNRECSVDFNAV